MLEEIIIRDEGREGVVEATDHRGGRWINKQRERESVRQEQNK